MSMRRFEVVRQVILRGEVVAESEDEAEAWCEHNMMDMRVTTDHVLTSLTKDLGPAEDEPEPASKSPSVASPS